MFSLRNHITMSAVNSFRGAFRIIRWTAMFYSISVGLPSFGEDNGDDGPRTIEEVYNLSVPVMYERLRPYEESQCGYSNVEPKLQILMSRAEASRSVQRFQQESWHFESEDTSPERVRHLRSFIDYLMADEYADPNLVLSEYQNLIGVFIGTESWDATREAVNQAGQYAASRFGPNHWLTLKVLRNNQLLSNLARFDKSDLELYKSLHKLSYGYVGDWERYRDGAERTKRLLGENSPLCVSLLLKEATAMKFGNVPETEQALLNVLLEAHRNSRQVALGWHPQSAAVCKYIADHYDAAGQPKQAEMYLLKGLERLPENANKNANFGEFEWEVSALLTSLKNRGRQQVASQRFDEAKNIYEALSRFYRFRDGPEASQTIQTRSQLQRVETAMQMTAKQQTLYADLENRLQQTVQLDDSDPQSFMKSQQQLLSDFSSLFGAAPRFEAERHAFIGDQFARSSQIDVALEHYVIALQTLAAGSLDITDSFYADVLKSFTVACDQKATQLGNEGQQSEIVSLREMQISVTSSGLGPFHWKVMDVRHELQDIIVESLLSASQQRELAESRTLLAFKEPNVANSNSPKPLSRREVLRRAETGLEIFGRILGSEHSEYVQSADQLASQYIRDGHFDRAEAMYQRILES